ncbi:LexA family transcriptional repressor [Paenibacillus sp. JDR-2]|uniref:LexA family protein n=1 Tax=Paenibacillus sp. (strain JDR-2) TaxID=324057 RepID=UPI000166A360|nr:LexA family transcriptional repressor [Paenibacillus sp. JDR-2]ACT00264.1 transcriptional repressor, LexA family [Paenibacillus sp. JDR-2]
MGKEIKALSKRQKDALEFIQEYQAKNGYAPTIREVGTGLGLKSSSTIHAIMARLQQKGYLVREGKSPRALRAAEVQRPDVATMKRHDQMLVAVFRELREAVGD